MKKNHFCISYFGNKRQEVELIYNEIKDDIKDVKYIVEPFCGSSALSYYISLKHPKKYTYVLNDNNKHLIELYEIMKDENKLNKLVEFMNSKKSISKEEYNKMNICDNVYNWTFKNKFYCIRPGLYPTKRGVGDDYFNNMLKCPMIEFMRNEKIILSNEPGLVKYDEFKTNKKALIFIDPPYLQSCNDFYLNKDVNIYEYLFDNDINKEKAKIILCLENTWIIKLLFKGKYNVVYDKKYELSKKKTSHIVITNKKK